MRLLDPILPWMLAVCLLIPRWVGAQQTTAQPNLQCHFEVASVRESKPDVRGSSWNLTYGRITIQNYTLRHLIRDAYGLKSEAQILGGPGWLDAKHFDISAKIDDADLARMKGMKWEEASKENQLMLQNLLAERFQLKVSSDQRILPLYELVVTKSGPKLKALPTLKDSSEENLREHSTNSGNGHLSAKAISMDSFADHLTLFGDTVERVVLNRTALSGDFDFTLNWTQDAGNGIPADAVLPGLFTALQEQLGLELKSSKGLIPVVIVEAANMPQPD